LKPVPCSLCPERAEYAYRKPKGGRVTYGGPTVPLCIEHLRQLYFAMHSEQRCAA
jgi:hypothetical protein